jgi:hypothetical protein
MSLCYHRRPTRAQPTRRRKKCVDVRVAFGHDVSPMARMFTAESLLREQTPSSFGARTCRPGSLLGHEQRPERREAVTVGIPDERW